MAFGFGLMLLVSGILLPALWERTAVPYVDEEQDHRDRIACEFRADRRSAGTVLGHEASAGPLARRPPSPEPPDPTAGR